MSSYLTLEQVEQILRPINPVRVSSRAGMAYVEAYDIKAHMARIFGVCRWSSEVIEQVLLFDEQVTMGNNKPGWYVGYRSLVKLTINAPDGTFLAVYTEGHAGDSTHPVRGEAHGGAITNSESYAFKRSACMALLDQGGLSLYGKGSKAALVKRTLVMPEGEGSSAQIDHDAEAVAPEHPDTPVAAEVVPLPPPVTVQAAAPPIESSSPDAPDVAALHAEQIVGIREAVKDLLDTGDKATASVGITRIRLAASKDKILMDPCRLPNGELVTLDVFLDEMSKRALKLRSGS